MTGMTLFLGIWILSGVPALLIPLARGRRLDPQYLHWAILEAIVLGPIATLLQLLNHKP